MKEDRGGRVSRPARAAGGRKKTVAGFCMRAGRMGAAAFGGKLWSRAAGKLDRSLQRDLSNPVYNFSGGAGILSDSVKSRWHGMGKMPAPRFRRR